MGVVGYGTLGKQVAALAGAFGMEICVIGKAAAPGTVLLAQALRESDFITIHVPLTKATENLIQRKELEQMKKSAFLINTARGGIVNEKDLAECLKEKKIAGAALDVLSREPPLGDNPLLQSDVPNLLVTPHVGWGSLESRMRLLGILKENILAFLQGSPKNLVV